MKRQKADNSDCQSHRAIICVVEVIERLYFQEDAHAGNGALSDLVEQVVVGPVSSSVLVGDDVARAAVAPVGSVDRVVTLVDITHAGAVSLEVAVAVFVGEVSVLAVSVG